MRKQAFLHLHELCVELRLFFEEHNEVPPDGCSHYDALNIDPMAINRSKGAHREAVHTLLTDLTTNLEGHNPDTSDSKNSEQSAINA